MDRAIAIASIAAVVLCLLLLPAKANAAAWYEPAKVGQKIIDDIANLPTEAIEGPQEFFRRIERVIGYSIDYGYYIIPTATGLALIYYYQPPQTGKRWVQVGEFLPGVKPSAQQMALSAGQKKARAMVARTLRPPRLR